LDAVPRLGWGSAPTPVEPLEPLRDDVGAAWLGVKRDDLCDALFGSTKVRKLDYVLAAQPWAEATGWVSTGGIGSGHLVAMTAAARQLERRFEATCFWTPASERALDNLAFVASFADTLRYRHTRPGMVLRYGGLVFGDGHDGARVVPPGGSNGVGALGGVRAGMELAAQIDAGALPLPDRVYVPLGSGGTVAGIALGLGMALGSRAPTVHAVACVEWPLITRRRVYDLIGQAQRVLARAGALELAAMSPAPLVTDHRWIGPRYAVATPAGLSACDRLQNVGVPLEPVYSGKTMASLLSDDQKGRNVLFWFTARRPQTLPSEPGWRERLPPALARRLGDPAGFTRRRFVLGGAALVAGAVGTARFTGYPGWPDWPGHVLAPWEGHVIRACAEALLPPALDDGAYAQVAVNVDRYVQSMPSHGRLELHAALASVEHATTPLAFKLSRLTALSPQSRLDYLETLAARGGLQRQLYRAVRDLCMVGYYQQPATWESINYGGPLALPTGPDPYAALVAPAGAAPPGWQA